MKLEGRREPRPRGSNEKYSPSKTVYLQGKWNFIVRSRVDLERGIEYGTVTRIERSRGTDSGRITRQTEVETLSSDGQCNYFWILETFKGTRTIARTRTSNADMQIFFVLVQGEGICLQNRCYCYQIGPLIIIYNFCIPFLEQCTRTRQPAV